MEKEKVKVKPLPESFGNLKEGDLVSYKRGGKTKIARVEAVSPAVPEHRTQYIRLVDEDIDGNGTDVVEMLQVRGAVITNGLVSRIRKVISDYKEEVHGEYDTDGVVSTVCEYLKKEGYECKSVNAVCEITF